MKPKAALDYQPFMRFTALLLTLAFSIELISCGSILYPHRHGQKGGKVDPAIVIADGALLLLFILPGVAAFAIDFASGAIYLGPGEKPFTSELEPIKVPPSELTRQNIERLVQERTGKRIDLSEASVYRVRGGEIKSIARDLQEGRAMNHALLMPLPLSAALSAQAAPAN